MLLQDVAARVVPPPDPLPRALRDTLDAVFRTAAYQPTRTESLWDRVRAAWAALRAALVSAVEQPPVFWTLVAVGAALAAFVAARWLTRREGAVTGPRSRRPGSAGPEADAWSASEAAAAAGRLHEAAHLTYAAVLDTLARRGLLRPHPSRTLGDYGRELRTRAAGAHPKFRAFARQYEPFVYGGAGTDRTRFEALRAAARALVAHDERPA